MARSPKNTSVARQVELIIRQLNSVSTLPQIAAGVLSNLAGGKANAEALNQIIQSDPALSAKVFSLAHQHGICFADGRPSVAEAVDKLPLDIIRDAVLSAKVFQAFDTDYDPDSTRILPRRQLALHALAVACCAKIIAAFALPEESAMVAFSAGLLHDIGKLAIDEVMPKSFAKIVSEAKARGVSMYEVEQAHLGLDHTIVGKRLAEKWHLPEEVTTAIWLHHSNTAAIAEELSSGAIARVVHFADIIARQCQIGDSGSFDVPVLPDEPNETLAIPPEKVQEIKDALRTEVSQKAETLGLTAPGGPAAYCEMVQETAVNLARDNSRLSTTNQTLATNAGSMDLVSGLLLETGSNTPSIDVATNAAVNWKKHYQTGAVCIYLQNPRDDGLLEVAIAGDAVEPVKLLLDRPDEPALIPAQSRDGFAVVDAGEQAEWLARNAGLKCDVSRMKLAPLISHGKILGAVVFEQRLPMGNDQLTASLAADAAILANIIALVLAAQKQGQVAEGFATLLRQLSDSRNQLAEAKALRAIAEMAAGASHELNNPLAVISGRLQLISEVETDENKKQMLQQIQVRTEEISDIVADLMAFARPTTPSPQKISVKKILDKAIALTKKKLGLKKMEIEQVGLKDLPEVNVDPDQIAQGLSHILANAQQAYDEAGGPVNIDASCSQLSGFVSFCISDSGCGMSAESLAQATRPFFSDKPAGRQRGMGLAHAQRLLQLNNAAMNLASEPDEGTTVIVRLPIAS